MDAGEWRLKGWMWFDGVGFWGFGFLWGVRFWLLVVEDSESQPGTARPQGQGQCGFEWAARRAQGSEVGFTFLPLGCSQEED